MDEHQPKNEELEPAPGRTPGFIANRIDIKSATIDCLNLVLESLEQDEEFRKHFPDEMSILIYTPMGTVEGEIISLPNKELAPEDPGIALSNLLISTRNRILADLEIESRAQYISNNTSFVSIRNAKITPYYGTNIHNLQILHLFADQIIGFSFGNK